MESWGRGYKNIIDICELRKAKLPIPEENSGGLVVECPPSKQYLDAEKKQGKMITEEVDKQHPIDFPKTSQRLPIEIPEYAQKTFKLICANPKATLKELSEKVGVSDRSIKTHLTTLKELGIIERIGGKTHGYWKVNDI